MQKSATIPSLLFEFIILQTVQECLCSLSKFVSASEPWYPLRDHFLIIAISTAISMLPLTCSLSIIFLCFTAVRVDPQCINGSC